MSDEPVKVAVGKALVRSESEMYQASLVTADDIEEARKDWKKKTDAESGPMIDADLQPDS